ncbi:hypothetical protein FB645_005987 [Coemansia sp. IMI 203386]|nr:hypothetical protein FB645_005987 [Coemansia sp. IMI 203386]
MFGLITKTLCISVGYLYPAYKCFKLLRGGPEAIGAVHGAAEERDVVKGILKYWIVMAGFTAVEFVADTFVFWYGAGFIYDRVLEPYLVAHEDKLDGYFRQARAVAQKSTSSASKTVYDKWVGYMQRAINQQSTDVSSSSLSSSHGSSISDKDRSSTGYTGLTSILRSVSQSVPHQASTAAGYLAGLSGISEGPQARADTVGKSTFSTMLTSWVTAFSSTSLTEISDDQRLHDIRSRKTQLQDMVAQLENSEQTIVSRNAAANTVQPSESTTQQEGPYNTHNEASEFEDDAVMVGGEAGVEGPGGNNGTSGEKQSGEEEPSNSETADGPKPEEKKAVNATRRWFW